jgi:hypothetical protein
VQLPSSRRWNWSYAVAALIATAGALSLIYQWYRTRPLWVDEEMIALNVRDRHFAELTGPLWMNQAAPFGWLALQRFMLVELGTAERALRAVPVLFAIATLIAAFWVGRRWMGPLGAVIMVLLCSFARFISYFPLEIKHYSADVFFGLLLPALALWTIESGTTRRVVIWWLTASVALWFANGAVFVVPGCAVVLCAWAWHRAGWRRALDVALPAVIWLASFAVHYRLSIGPAMQNQDLQGYWASALPPRTSDLGALLEWLGAQAKPLAIDPGGTGLWIAFWLAAAGGLFLAARANLPLGLVLLSVPITAFLLATLRLVPLRGRLFLWAIPALYAALAIAADGTVRCARQSLAGRRWLGAGVCALGALVAIDVSVDIVRSGVREISTQPASKHNLDDRSALRILMALREPGDALATMHLGLPAVWWYGGVSVRAPNLGRTFEKDGGPILEIERRWGSDCVRENLTSALAGRNRIGVYLGFESRGVEGLLELVFDSLSQLGRLTAYRGVAEEGVVAVFDLREPPKSWMVILTRPSGETLKPVTRPSGCVGFFPAVRW